MSELLEKILSNDNMNAAYKRVCANKGAGGVDGITVEELDNYIRENGNNIREQIRRREYKPQPVKTERRSKETRNTNRNRQGDSARYSTGNKPYV